MTVYTPEDLRLRFRVAKETIRQWSIEFAEYLSPSATPVEKGKHRLYTDEDWMVFSLVAEMKDRGVTYDEIHLSLKNGQRGDAPDGNQSTVLGIPEKQIALIQMRLLELEDEVERLKPFESNAVVEKALRERAEQQLENERQRNQEQVNKLNEEIARLNRELGRLEKGND